MNVTPDEVPCYRCGELVPGQMNVVVVRPDIEGNPVEATEAPPLNDPLAFSSQGFAYATTCPSCHEAGIQSNRDLIDTLNAAGEEREVIAMLRADQQRLHDELRRTLEFAEVHGIEDEQIAALREALPAVRRIIETLDDALRRESQD